jgi:uncharacterized ferritin-like protein (DUF455 family)
MSLQLRELAERALFASDLETKLACPEEIVDTRPGDAIEAPPEPGRPDGLHFKPTSIQAAFPDTQKLDNDRDRGALLHFFANHELLAVELMALVLLKFPDAPGAFRKGVLNTLKDEQEHVRLYLDRMRECGVEFGELPVSGFFWKFIADMTSPMDYVSRLSLTFEQANLDYSRFFAERFNEAGDGGTAAILDRIYKDEIAHVGYGLKWFRKWKDQKLSDWEAFSRQLHFPLSPSRAKAAPFNAEGRRRAGLKDGFIDELFVYSKSKGRTPAVHVFNPFTEIRLGKGKGHKPNKFQRAMARDLAILPAWICSHEDAVLIPERPSTRFLSAMKRLGFDPPDFQEIPKNQINRQHELRNRKLAELRPWAWGPDSLSLLKPLFPNLTSEDAPELRWNDGIRELYSKAWDAAFLKDFLKSRHDRDWLCAEEDIGIHATNDETALRAVNEIRQRGHLKVIVKFVHGAAGHGMIRLWEPELSDDQRQWIRSHTSEGRSVLVEPWHERVADLSVQFEMTKDGLRQLGFTRVFNDLRGQFVASAVSSGIGRLLTPELSRFVHTGAGRGENRLQLLFSDLAAPLESRLLERGFRGPIGIDSYIYRTEAGELRLKPIVEINPRHTMGRVAMELKRFANTGRVSALRLINTSQVRAAGCGSFADYAALMEERFPLALTGAPRRRIDEGFVPLNDPEAVTAYLPVFHVARSVDTIQAPGHVSADAAT